MNKEIKVIAQNKKANHDYFIEETYEAGLVLTGTEIKSIRRGRINLKDSYCQTRLGEMFVYNMHISEIEKIFKKSVTTQTNRRSSTYSPILCTHSIQ